MMTIAQGILFLIQNGPAAYNAAKSLYEAVKKDLSPTEQADIDAALEAAKANDADATAGADEALDDASKK